MRNRSLMLAAAALVMAACADDQHPSAPVSSHSIVRSSAMGDVSPNAQAATPYAKPQDQVGFTKVVYVGSGNVSAPAGQTTAGSATCPAGSIAISGGYTLYVTAGATSPLVTTTSPAGLTPNPTGWDVAISNEAAGAGAAAFQVYALCAS